MTTSNGANPDILHFMEVICFIFWILFFALNPAWMAKLWQIINLYEPQRVFFVLNTFLLKAVQRDIIIIIIIIVFRNQSNMS